MSALLTADQKLHLESTTASIERILLTKTLRTDRPILNTQHKADMLLLAPSFSATTKYAHPHDRPNGAASASWSHRSKCAQIYSTSRGIRTKELDREQEIAYGLQPKAYEPTALTSLRPMHR